MSSSDSGDQASARGMSQLLLIPYSRGFFHGHLYSFVNFVNVVYLCTYIYMNFHEFLLIMKMLDTIPSAHTYIRTCVSMQQSNS